MHGTLDEYETGCRCVDCGFAHRFHSLLDEMGLTPSRPVKRFASPKVSAARPFPGRELVLAAGEPNMKALAEMIGVHRHSIRNWLRNGVCLSPYEADELAVRVGLHPAFVWGDRWFV